VISVEFVGVRNSAEKARLLARGAPRRERAASEALAYDCIRHLDFLGHALENGRGADFRESLYWRYLVAVGHTPASADRRCIRYAELARGIEREGFDPQRDRIAVTDDGVRLNGSHRAAIARHLGVGELDVDVFSWAGCVPRWRVRHVAEEARVKREAQRQHLGREARDGASGEPLGRVAFVDADGPGRVAAALGRRARPVLVIEREDGGLERRRLESVELR
jgi:hypothetical protein